MTRQALLVALMGLFILGVLTQSLQTDAAQTRTAHTWWTVFLILMPVGLAATTWRNLRWGAMAGVLYGTVGLALDLATAVQIITKDSDLLMPLMRSEISGVLNFLLIVFGGRAVLEIAQTPPPPGSRPPSPPTPFSSASG